MFFIFDSVTNSWLRSEGSTLPSVATPNAAGLMSAEDLQKLNRLVLPPPQTTIRGEECNTRFTAGVIGVEGDGFVEVSGSGEVINTVDDKVVGDNLPLELHQHTNTFDFRLNIRNLVDRMQDNDKLIIRSKPGDKGSTG